MKNFGKNYLVIPNKSTQDDENIYLKEISKLESRGHRVPPIVVNLTRTQTNDASLNGKMIFTLSPTECKLWSRESQECIKTVKIVSNDPNESVQIRKATSGFLLYDNRHAFVGTASGQIVLVDLRSSDIIQVLANENKPHFGSIRSIINLKDKKTLIAGCSSKRISFWILSLDNSQTICLKEKKFFSSDDEKKKNYKDVPDQIVCLTATHDSKLVCVAMQNMKVNIYEIDTFKKTHCLFGHAAPVQSMAVNPKNTVLITGSSDKTLRIWDLQFGNCLRRFTTHVASITSVAILNDSLAFSADSEGNIHQWDIKRNTQVTILKGHHGCINSLDAITTVRKLPKEIETLGLSKKERTKRKRENKLKQDKKKKRKRNQEASDSDIEEAEYLAQLSNDSGEEGDDFDDLEYCGGLIASVGQDFSLRLWSEDENHLTIVEEEELKRLEKLEIEESLSKTQIIVPGTKSTDLTESTLLGKLSNDNIVGTDMIIEAIDIYTKTLEEMKLNKGKIVDPHPLFSVRKADNDPELFLLRSLVMLKNPTRSLAAGCGAGLEYSLSQLPIQFVDILIPHLFSWYKKGVEVELCARMIRFLVDLHHGRFIQPLSDENSFSLTKIKETFSNDSIENLEKKLQINIFSLEYFANKLDLDQKSDYFLETRKNIKKKSKAFVKTS